MVDPEKENFMFPFYFKNQNFNPSKKDSVFYILAENGLFLVKDVDLFKACVKVEGFPGLLSHLESVELKFPKIPKILVEMAVGFFIEVFRRYRSEAIVLIFYSPLKGFKIIAPEQYVYGRNPWKTQYGVDYRNFPTPGGYYRMGTWHSHCDLPASHSTVDDLDEENEDGLHIVCGDLHWGPPSFSASFVANGRRFLLDENQIFEGYQHPIFPPPKKWLKRVRVIESYSNASFFYLPRIEEKENEGKSTKV